MAKGSDATLLLASFAPRTNGEALARAAEVPAGAGGVEVRLDRLEEPPALGAIRAAFAGRTLLATVRSVDEGGGSAAGEEERSRLLSEALAAGFDLADVEALRPGGERLLGLPPARVVASFHDTAGVPPDLPALLARLSEKGPRHAKLVVTAADSTGALAALEAQASVLPSSRDGGGTSFTCLAMGEAGIATRALSPYLGAGLSFGAFEGPGPAGQAAPTAPGQLPVSELSEVYGVGRRRGVSALCVLLGGVVSHSLSPALHNGNFEATSPALLYVPFALRSLLEELPALASRLAALGLPIAGASVTIPFKEQAALLAGGTGATGGAGREAAANTLLPEGGGWRAENTDRDAFEALVPRAPRGARALVLGAGGTARTAAEALAALGYRVTVSSRREAPARAVADAAGGEIVSAAALVADPRARLWTVLVNATPLGLRPDDPLPCPESLVTPSLLVVDAPYRPGGTALARLAAARGARVADGFALLVAQAARQATLFTSRPATARSLLATLPASRRSLFDIDRKGTP